MWQISSCMHYLQALNHCKILPKVNKKCTSRGRDARYRPPRRTQGSGVPTWTFSNRWRGFWGRQGRCSSQNQVLSWILQGFHWFLTVQQYLQTVQYDEFSHVFDGYFCKTAIWCTKIYFSITFGFFLKQNIVPGECGKVHRRSAGD